MTQDISRVSDIKLSNFSNVFRLIILTELPLSITNFIGRVLLNVNVVFANGLLIEKQYSSSEGFSFRSKLAGKFWGFDLQTAANCPTFSHFRQVFPFVILHLLARWVELPQQKHHLLEGKLYLSCVTFSLAMPVCILSCCIAINCISSSSIAWAFSTTKVWDWVLAVTDAVSDLTNTYQ